MFRTVIACGFWVAFTTGGTPVVPFAGETPATPIKGKMPVLVAPPRRRRSQLGRDKRGPSRGGSPHRVKRRERRFPEGRDKRGPSRGGGRGTTALPGEADVLCAVRHIF